MHVDRDDIPEYLRRKKRNPWRMFSLLGIGSAITCTLLVLFAQPVVIDIVQLKNALRVGGQPVFAQSQQVVIQQPPGQIYQQLESATRWEQSGTTQKEMVSGRQTAFNDLNYTPKGAVNVITFEEIPIHKALESSRKASMVTIVGDSNAKRDFCWMHKEGSIEKRDCKQQVDLYLRNKNL